MTKKKQPVYTKRCEHLTAKPSTDGQGITRYREEVCGEFIPDDYRCCDSCLKLDYGLWGQTRSMPECAHDPDPYYEEDVVLAVIRKAERRFYEVKAMEGVFDDQED